MHMDIFAGNTLLLVTLTTLWTLPWKGWALWLAARRKEKWWFIAMLVLNTLAILEIFYIFAIAKQRDTQQQDEHVM